MAITVATITVDRDQGTYRKITVIFEDHLGKVYDPYRYKADIGEDIEVTKWVHATEFWNTKISGEVSEHWAAMEQSGNPYYEFIDPLWQRKVFYYTTFENSFSINIKRALGPEFDHSNSQGVRYIKTVWDAGTTIGEEFNTLLGMTNPQINNISSDVANIDSIDTIEAGMDGQHFDGDGNPIL